MNLNRVAVWAVTIFTALIFLMSGLQKLTAAAVWRDQFVNQWGLPWWLAAVVALGEMGGAVLLLMPKTAVYGGAIIAFIMLGATGTHLMAGEYPNMAVTVVLGALASFVAWYRCPWCKAEPD